MLWAWLTGRVLTMASNTEEEIMKKRQAYIQGYNPPMWTSNHVDPVSGTQDQVLMVPRTNIVFFGPVGSGKSSLIGSLCRACSNSRDFPSRVRQTIRHPHQPGEGTQQWLETPGNDRHTITYMDTRGDTEYDVQERMMHEFSLRGMYKDEAPLTKMSFYHKKWWTTQRFFWERTLTEVPHCVVLVFDGSQDPFLDEESLLFFQTVFQDCSAHGYEPVVVITHLDLVCRDAIQQGKNVQFEIEHKEDKVLQAFEDFHLSRKCIYFVTNFHNGERGHIPMWLPSHNGFDKSQKKMVDLARELLNVGNRFIERNYGRSKCTVL